VRENLTHGSVRGIDSILNIKLFIRRNLNVYSTFGNGDYYQGEFRDNKFNGKGLSVTADGSVYIGEWENGEPHGRGLIENENGEVYAGEVEKGEPMGKGAYWWSYNHKYIGEFYFGQFHGHGIYIDYSVPEELIGEWFVGEYQEDE